MKKRWIWLPVLLAVMSLILAACPAPAAPANPVGAPAVQDAAGDNPAIDEEPAVDEESPAAPDPAAANPAEAPAPDESASQDAAEAPPAGPEQDPLAIDPGRPGFTYDGSPSLGDPDAPVIIIDFSDFQ